MDSSSPGSSSSIASSGDLTADRRFDFARQLLARGEAAAAADLMAQALELAPHWAEGRFTLAETLARAGDHERAVAAFKAYLAIDGSDSMGAAARLHLLSGGDVPVFSDAYVRRLFDQYAPRFDKALIERLGYAVPALLSALIDRAWPGRRFMRAVDLGCGTGLVGAALRDRIAWLAGIDLSPGMIAIAERKGLYQHLTVGELTLALTDLAGLDLAIAGDVLCYIRDLAPVFAAVHRALTDGGVFAFSVERDAGDGATLGPGQRFRHGTQLIHRLTVATGFAVTAEYPAVLRRDGDQNIDGTIFLLLKIGSNPIYSPTV